LKLPAFLRPLSLEERVSRELHEAKLARLAAYSQYEYFGASIELAEARIKRLENELSKLINEPLEVRGAQ
jgi:hypothetical protein